MGGTPKTVQWRGITTDPETAAMLAAIAADVGQDIYVRPIPGCGSYQTATKASAGTHAGGGAVDLDCEGLTDAQARRLETSCRKMGGAAWWRPRQKGLWQSHVHVLRIDCADLAPNARTQLKDYAAGWSGLPIGGRTLRDSGTRSWVGHRWAAVKAAMAKTQVGTGSNPPIGGPITPKPPTQEDNMPTPAQLWDYPMGQNPGDPKKATDAGDALKIASNYAYHNFRELVDQRQKLADLTAAVQTLAAAVADLKKG